MSNEFKKNAMFAKAAKWLKLLNLAIPWTISTITMSFKLDFGKAVT